MDKWEADIYVVIKHAGDLPIGDGPKCTLHRDLLLSCGFLPATTVELAQPTPVCRPPTRHHPDNCGRVDLDLSPGSS